MGQFDDDKARDAVLAGQKTELEARQLRKRLRRRTKKDSRRRIGQIEAMIFEINDRMRPIRRYIGMIPYHDVPPDIESTLGEVSAALQEHRRALKRMLPPENR